jgi:hypothetical protein
MHNQQILTATELVQERHRERLAGVRLRQPGSRGGADGWVLQVIHGLAGWARTLSRSADREIARHPAAPGTSRERVDSVPLLGEGQTLVSWRRLD